MSDEDDDYYNNEEFQPHMPMSRDSSFAIGLPTDPNEYQLRLEKFVFPFVQESIKTDEAFMSKAPIAKKRTLLMVDIVSFSSFVEVLPTNSVIEFAEFFFSLCEKIIVENKGKVIEFLGDSLTAMFSEHQADEAVLSGVTILQKLDNLHQLAKEERINKGGDPIPEESLFANIAVSRAEVIEGKIGTETNGNYTCIGDAMNIVNHLMKMTPDLPYFLLFDDGVSSKLTKFSKESIKQLGKVRVKGQSSSIFVHAIAVPVNQKPADLQAQIDEYIDNFTTEEIKKLRIQQRRETTKNSKQLAPSSHAEIKKLSSSFSSSSSTSGGNNSSTSPGPNNAAKANQSQNLRASVDKDRKQQKEQEKYYAEQQKDQERAYKEKEKEKEKEQQQIIMQTKDQIAEVERRLKRAEDDLRNKTEDSAYLKTRSEIEFKTKTEDIKKREIEIEVKHTHIAKKEEVVSQKSLEITRKETELLKKEQELYKREQELTARMAEAEKQLKSGGVRSSWNEKRNSRAKVLSLSSETSISSISVSSELEDNNPSSKTPKEKEKDKEKGVEKKEDTVSIQTLQALLQQQLSFSNEKIKELEAKITENSDKHSGDIKRLQSELRDILDKKQNKGSGLTPLGGPVSPSKTGCFGFGSKIIPL